MSDELLGLHAVVHGRVQGVSFRYYTIHRAVELNLTGWVMNRRDGRSVEVVAEGTRNRLEALLDWLHQGSPSAQVEQVEAEWLVATGEFSDFGTRYIRS